MDLFLKPASRRQDGPHAPEFGKALEATKIGISWIGLLIPFERQ